MGWIAHLPTAQARSHLCMVKIHKHHRTEDQAK